MKGTTMRAAAAALLTAATVAAGPGTAQEVHRLQGDEVAIYNLAGHARLVRGSGPDVVVRITRGGGDAERLDVTVGEVRGREALRIVYPGDRVIYPEMGRRSRTNVRVRADGTFYGGRGGDEVSIRGSGRGLEAWADLEVEVPAGKDVVLRLAVGPVEARGTEGPLLIDIGSGEVHAADVTGRLNIDTGSGEVTVEGVRGPLLVDTGSGSVEVTGARGASVEIDTGSGGVRGRDIETERLLVDTGSGSVELAEVAAERILVDTGSGSVDLSLTRAVEELDVDTGSGGVTIRAPETLDATVELDTGSGGIDVDFPLRARSARRDHVEGRIGDGSGRIHIDTGSGAIRLIRN